MKIITKILSLCLLIGVALFNSGCGGGSHGTDSAEKVQLAKLSKTWTLTSAKLDDVDRTSDFSGLALTISGTYSKDGDTYTYSFQGHRPQPSPWPATGTWKFGANPSTDLVRLDDSPPLALTYTVSDNSLEIKFNYPNSAAGFAGGRVEQVSGNWDFVFSK